MPTDVLTATDIEGSAPILGTPTLGIVHPLVAAPILMDDPVLGTSFLPFDASARWPIRPNWATAVNETYEYRTDILASRAGHEQRRALRSQPRKVWDYKALMRSEDRRDADRFITSRYDQMAYFANPVKNILTTGELAATGSTFTVAAVPDWLVADAVLALSYDGDYTLVYVEGIIGTTVTIRGVSMGVWPVGTKVRPTEACRIGQGTKLKMETRGVGTAAVVLESDPGLLYLPDPEAAGDTFNGREVFTKQPNWKNGVDLSFESMRELVDYGQGRVSAFAPSTFMTRDYQGTYLGRNAAEVRYVVDFFRRMKGRQGEFYCPTGNADLVPSQALVSGQAILKTAGLDDYAVHAPSSFTGSRLVNKALLVMLRDGTYLTNTISSVSISGADTQINLGANWAQNVALADIAYVSYLPVCRFAADAITIQWLTASVAQFTLAFHTLESLAAE